MKPIKQNLTSEPMQKGLGFLNLETQLTKGKFMLKKTMIAAVCAALFISGCSSEKAESDYEKQVKMKDAVQGSADDSTQYTQAVEVVQDIGPDGQPIGPAAMPEEGMEGAVEEGAEPEGVQPE
ncbi:hypothetical protein [uncultured Psychrobacter sp.]|uniref:hypothetical protein n=1 Tax=uncultured Psychrobacter sp. TaxID=259303 RepID=UPI0030D74F90